MVNNDGIFCKSHCICISMFLSQSQFDQFERKLKSLRAELDKKIDATTKHVLKTKPNITARLVTSAKVKGKIGLVLKIYLKENEDYKNFYKIFPLFQKIISLPKMFTKNIEGISCTGFIFNAKKFKTAGGFELPAEIHVNPELIPKVGKPRIAGLTLIFNKSALGIKSVETKFENEEISIFSSTSYKFTTTKEILSKTYSHNLEVAELFVEAI